MDMTTNSLNAASGIDLARLNLENSRANMAQILEGDSSDIRQTAENFEEMILAQMLAPMFQGMEADPMFGGGHAEETWRGLLVEEYGRSIMQRGGIGIADQVEAQLLRMQEMAHAG